MIVNPASLGIWLLQMVCVLFPMLLYQSFFRKKFGQKRIQKTILAVLCGISIMICMTFPLSLDNGLRLDFRSIPLITSFFYGGFSTGLILTALMMIYRILLGGPGVFMEGLGIPFFELLIFAFILPRYDKWKQKKQIFFTYLCLTLTIIFYLFETIMFSGYVFTKNEIILWMIFCILNYITFWMVLYLQTSLRDMEEMGTKVIQFERSHTINHLLVYISQQIFSPILMAKDSISKIKDDANLSADQSSSITQAIKNLNQAEESLRDYMIVLDPELKPHESIPLEKMIQDTIQLIHPFAEFHNVELQFLSTAENDLILKEYSLFRYALLNIIKNGVEACAPGGRVDVYLHELIDQFYIIIEDNGPGLPQEVLSHFGKPLHSQKENGTGLGIAAALKIIESLGGKMEVESKQEVGTSFSLYFPKKNFIAKSKTFSSFS